MHRLSIAVLLSVALVVPSAALAQEYKINLNRPLKAGTYAFSATKSEVSDWTDTDGSKQRDQNDQFALEGTLTMTANEATGSSYGKLTVAKCLFNRKPKLAAGGVIDIQNQEEDFSLTIKGKPIEKDTAEFISEALPEEEAGENSDGDLYDPPKPIKVGETWKVDAAKFARSQTDVGEIPLKSVSGQGKLNRVMDFRGQQCLDVDVTVSFDALVKKTGRKLKVKQSYNWIMPVDKGPIYKGESRFSSTAYVDGSLNVLTITSSSQIAPPVVERK